MNAKKSGLADSPFFRPAEPATPPLQPESLQMRTVAPVPESVPVYTDAQSHERTPAHIHNRANEPMRERSDTQTNDGTSSQAHERTITQMNASTDAHLHERTDAQPT